MKHMKKILAVALIVMSLFAIALPAMAQGPEWRMGTVFGGQLAFRNAPNGTRLAWIPNGTRLNCYYNNWNDAWFWTYFPVNGTTTNGYVSSAWILLDGTVG